MSVDKYLKRNDVLASSEILSVDTEDYGRIDVVPVEYLTGLPATDARPVKHGKWDGYRCPECNVYADYFISGNFYFDERPNFCPNCGTIMDLSEDYVEKEEEE